MRFPLSGILAQRLADGIDCQLHSYGLYSGARLCSQDIFWNSPQLLNVPREIRGVTRYQTGHFARDLIVWIAILKRSQNLCFANFFEFWFRVNNTTHAAFIS